MLSSPTTKKRNDKKSFCGCKASLFEGRWTEEIGNKRKPRPARGERGREGRVNFFSFSLACFTLEGQRKRLGVICQPLLVFPFFKSKGLTHVGNSLRHENLFAFSCKGKILGEVQTFVSVLFPFTKFMKNVFVLRINKLRYALPFFPSNLARWSLLSGLSPSLSLFPSQRQYVLLK